MKAVTKGLIMSFFSITIALKSRDQAIGAASAKACRATGAIKAPLTTVSIGVDKTPDPKPTVTVKRKSIVGYVQHSDARISPQIHTRVLAYRNAVPGVTTDIVVGDIRVRDTENSHAIVAIAADRVCRDTGVGRAGYTDPSTAIVMNVVRTWRQIVYALKSDTGIGAFIHINTVTIIGVYGVIDDYCRSTHVYQYSVPPSRDRPEILYNNSTPPYLNGGSGSAVCRVPHPRSGHPV